MDSDIIRDTIDRFWKVRVAGDKAGLRSFMAPNAIYEMVGANAFADPGLVGPAPMGPAADHLIEAFKFNSVERLSDVVNGNSAAVVLRIQVAYRGGPLTTSEVCDVWEFDDAGKAKSLRQFVDTALVNRMIAGLV